MTEHSQNTVGGISKDDDMQNFTTLQDILETVFYTEQTGGSTSGGGGGDIIWERREQITNQEEIDF